MLWPISVQDVTLCLVWVALVHKTLHSACCVLFWYWTFPGGFLSLYKRPPSLSQLVATWLLQLHETVNGACCGLFRYRTFPDGFPDLFVPNARTARNRDVAFLASFSNPSVIFEQISIIYALPRMFVRSFTLVLPFFPTGTQERMEDEGDIATAVTLSRILSNIPISRGGPTSVVIFDIHALQVCNLGHSL